MSWTRLIAVLGVALVGCNGVGTADLHRFVRAEDEEYAHAYFDSIRFERIDYAVGELSPVVAGLPGMRDSILAIASYLPHGPLDSVHLIGAGRFTSSSMDRSELTFEYHAVSGWGVSSISLLNENGRRSILGIHTGRLPRPLEVTNAFTLHDKSFGHYLMIGLMIASVGMAFGTAVLALFTPMKHRWAWALLALVGAGTFAFNWTTGEGRLGLLNLLFFDAAYMKGGPAAPWVLQVAFPVGALMTLRRVRSVRQAPAPVPAPPAEAEPAPAV